MIIEVWAQLPKIAGGLDFWGLWTANVPIWTFEYLQNVAVSFCQLAIGAERDVINFWDRAGSGNLTRAAARQNVALTDGRACRPRNCRPGPPGRAAAYVAGEATAPGARRATPDTSWPTTPPSRGTRPCTRLPPPSSAEATTATRPAQRAGRHASMRELPPIRGSRGTIAAAAQLAAAKANGSTRSARSKRQAEEMALAPGQADRERRGQGTRRGADAGETVAARARAGARPRCSTRSRPSSSPPRCGTRWATDVPPLPPLPRHGARRRELMQRAYNFENDVALGLIRGDYTTDEVKGLLGADTLMADIQTFTYDLITSTAPKPQPVRQTISLAERYPFVFETQFRPSGCMEFETRSRTSTGLSRRLRRPHRGRRGRGRRHRARHRDHRHADERRHLALPDPDRRAGAGATSASSTASRRRETLVLSDYDIRTDALLVDDRPPPAPGVRGRWCGVDMDARRCRREVNDLDYGALTDVRLTFTTRPASTRSCAKRCAPSWRLGPGVRAPTTAAAAVALPRRLLPVPRHRQPRHPLGGRRLPGQRGRPDARRARPHRRHDTAARARRDHAARQGARRHGRSTVTTGADGTVAADRAGRARRRALARRLDRSRSSAADNPTWVDRRRTRRSTRSTTSSLLLGYSFTPRTLKGHGEPDVGFDAQTPSLPGGGGGGRARRDLHSRPVHRNRHLRRSRSTCPTAPTTSAPSSCCGTTPASPNGPFGRGGPCRCPACSASRCGRPSRATTTPTPSCSRAPATAAHRGRRARRPEVDAGDWRVHRSARRRRVRRHRPRGPALRPGDHARQPYRRPRRTPWSWLAGAHRRRPRQQRHARLAARRRAALPRSGWSTARTRSRSPTNRGRTGSGGGAAASLLETDERCATIELRIPDRRRAAGAPLGRSATSRPSRTESRCSHGHADRPRPTAPSSRPRRSSRLHEPPRRACSARGARTPGMRPGPTRRPPAVSSSSTGTATACPTCSRSARRRAPRVAQPRWRLGPSAASLRTCRSSRATPPAPGWSTWTATAAPTRCASTCRRSGLPAPHGRAASSGRCSGRARRRCRSARRRAASATSTATAIVDLVWSTGDALLLAHQDAAGGWEERPQVVPARARRPADGLRRPARVPAPT